MGEQSLIDVPRPPMVPGGVYFFIYGEWTETRGGSQIATLDNPDPTAQVYQRRLGINEAIAMHPTVYAIMIQQARPGYTVKWATSIHKELFDWYKEVERRIGQAIAQSNGQGKP